MKILKKILIISLMTNIKAYAGNSSSGELIPHLSSMVAGSGFEVCSPLEFLEEEKEIKKLSYVENSRYKDFSLEELERDVQYEGNLVRFKKGTTIGKKAKQDFLKTLFIKKIRQTVAPEEANADNKKIFSIGELLLTFSPEQDKAVLHQMSHTADILFWNDFYLQKPVWAYQNLKYAQQEIGEDSARIRHIQFLRKYEHLDSFIHVFPEMMEFERDFYPQAIRSADIVYASSLERGVWSETYQLRQVFSKAGLYETSQEKKDEYERKLKSLPFQHIPYTVAGRKITCSPADIIRIQQIKGFVFRFNVDGTIFNFEESQQDQKESAKKPLTQKQKEKRKKKKAAYRARQKVASQENGIEIKNSEEFDFLQEREADEEASVVLNPFADDVNLPSKVEEVSVADEQEEAFDYQEILQEERDRSLAKKELQAKKESTQKQDDFQEIQVSGENIWIIQQAYLGQAAEKRKVHNLLNEIDGLSNSGLKKDEAQRYLQRMSYLLGIKGETSPTHIKILGIPFGYHEVHGSHGSNWTVDMVKRLKKFAVQVRSVFDHIT